MKKRGFSLIELMVGVFIISAIIVMVCSLYTYLFKISQKGVDLTAGTAVGEKVLEEFVEANKTLKAGTFTGSKSVNTSVFYYVIEVSGDIASGEFGLKKVDITIRWWDGKNTDESLGSQFATATQPYEEYTLEPGGEKIDTTERKAAYGYAHTKITKLVFCKS